KTKVLSPRILPDDLRTAVNSVVSYESHTPKPHFPLISLEITMNILDLNTLALDLVAKDFSDGHAPHNGGPTRTSRALAIIHLAARDAYAMVTESYAAKLDTKVNPLPPRPDGVQKTEEDGTSAALGAGIRVCALLYRDFSAFISERTADF